jgi:hypothetical protein
MDFEAKKRKRLMWRIVRYFFTLLTIFTVATILIFVLLGYRFDRMDGTIRQGGLVQFLSQPSGASVTVGSAKLVDKTRSKITLIPGDYLVKMELDGYRLWQKNITVEAGRVLWLNSARFVPRDVTTEPIATFSKLSDSTSRPKGKYFTVLTDKTKPVLTRIAIDTENAIQTTVTVPATSFSSSKNHAFSFLPWTSDDRHILLAHSFKKSREVLFVDVDDITKTIRIPSIGTIQPKDVISDPRNSSDLIVRYTDGSVRLVDGETANVSEAILTNTTSIDTLENSLVFVRNSSKSKIETGYLSLNSKKARVVATYTKGKPIHMQIQKYFGVYFMTTAVDKDITIQKMIDLPPSDSDDPLTTEEVASYTSQTAPYMLQSKSGGRQVMMFESQFVTNYDLELGTLTSTPIKGASKKSTEVYNWLDGQHFWSDASGMLRQYEYDGANQTDIVKVAKGFSASYSPNDKYLYSVGKTGTGFTLQRSTMIVN